MPKMLNPYFVNEQELPTVESPTTDTFITFDIDNQGGWGHDTQVDCSCPGASQPLIQTFPKGSDAFRIAFEGLEPGEHTATFDFHKKDDTISLASLEWTWAQS